MTKKLAEAPVRKHRRARNIGKGNMLNINDVMRDESVSQAAKQKLSSAILAHVVLIATINPTWIAARLYMASSDAWDEARAEYGYENVMDEREQAIVRSHRPLIDLLRAIQKGETEETPSVETPTTDRPVDLNLWRQSRPRPIKRVVVTIE
jgi:hypothetical protein